jgi:hypothetical protein
MKDGKKDDERWTITAASQPTPPPSPPSSPPLHQHHHRHHYHHHHRHHHLFTNTITVTTATTVTTTSPPTPPPSPLPLPSPLPPQPLYPPPPSHKEDGECDVCGVCHHDHRVVWSHKSNVTCLLLLSFLPSFLELPFNLPSFLPSFTFLPSSFLP